MAELAVGNFVSFRVNGVANRHFQNFFIGEEITYDSEKFNFVPFGFSGVTVNKTGDGTEASILLPNSTSTDDAASNVGVLARTVATTAIEERWTAHVRTLIVDPDDKTSFTLLSQYYGQVVAGTWDNANISLNLSSVIDAIGADVPQRKLNQSLVGNLPTTANVRLQ